MLHIFRLIFECMANVIKMLFKIDMGFMSVGMFLSIIGFGIPAMLLFYNFLKSRGDK